MVRLAIVEDEDIYALQLMDFIDRLSKEKSLQIRCKRYRDGDEITEHYKAEFDIILMDIQMRFMDGMSAALQIRRQDAEVIIMFITNRADYAIRGYEVGALDYILKPVEYFSFASKLERAISKLQALKKHSLYINSSTGGQRLYTEDIRYIESIGHQLHFHTKTGLYTARLKISDMEKELEPYHFYRINKGYLVNMAAVEGIRGNICLAGDTELLISRAKKASFMEALHHYLAEI